MIYTIHFWYKKSNSKKSAHKFEGIVFAKNEDHAKELVKNLFTDFPIVVEGMMTARGSLTERTLNDIYNERPELIGISPEQGHIYDEFSHRNSIRRYVGK
ncbi:hypothetical protein [Paenibacillus spongiae]|uniref:Uncharacterized protein n=1 Tax=Paenibacillus spongiae TaxID=2909671 RepID=A0ABY5SEV4_9BACL|nr:hypothetical protein [Paenibacillus spongiae]UVI32063.1 hypothetical protein L1F29_09700 [Paenibacillus spongiae]